MFCYFPNMIANLFALLAAYPGIIYFVAGEDDMMFKSLLLASSQYCFVNESTIRIKLMTLYVNIISTTGDWIMASNNIDLVHGSC